MSQDTSSNPSLRGEARHPVTWRATIRCPDWQAAEHVAATNVSKGGMFVRAAHPPAVGTQVQIVLVLPDGREELLTGVVRHQVPPGPRATVTGVGVEIDRSCQPLMGALVEIARIEQGLPPVPPPTPPPAPRPSGAAPKREARLAPQVVQAAGIDFGVSFSRVSMAGSDNTVMIVDGEGRALVPSLVAFPEGEPPAVGWRAHGLQATIPHRTLGSLKRLLGRRHSDPRVAGLLHGLPLAHRAGPDDSILIEADGGPMALPQICALILAELKAMAEAQIGRPIVRTTFSHPVGCGEPYRRDLGRAAMLAGLEVAGFVEEPLAGALGYGLGGAKNEIVAVYDFGGGTFDFALVDLSYDHHRLLASGGDEWLGGDDFDQGIAEAAANAYWRNHKVELRDRAVEWGQLLRAAEAVKRELSASPTSRLGVPGLKPSLELSVDRSALQRLCYPLFARSIDVCKETLERAGLEPTQVGTVVLSGGTTQIPFIQEGLSAFFERPVRNVAGLDPQEAVALGCSVFGTRQRV